MLPMFRPVDPAPGESFALLHPRGAAFSPLWHVHDHFELNHVVAGRGLRWIGSCSDHFAEGDVVLVPPHVPHSWNSDGDSGREGVEAVVAMFGPELFGGEHGPPEWNAARALLADAGGALAFDDADGSIGHELRGMAEEPPAKRLLSLLGLLDRLARTPRRRLSRSDDGDSDDLADLSLVRRTLARLRDSCSDSLSQSGLASEMGVSPSRLSRVFKRVTGGTFVSHVNELRISRACSLLQEGRLSISQISFEAGYMNLSNFNRRFKRTVGQTPQTYRQQFRTSMASERRQ